ncbi:DUF6153 family protein [Rhodococcus aerolatus]
MTKRRAAPASGGNAARWLLVLAVVLGVFGMHSLLVDSSPAAANAAMVGVVGHTSMPGAVSDRATPPADALLAPAEAPLASVSGAGAPMVMGDMAMGCLAVLAATALVLLALTSRGSAAPPRPASKLCASGGARSSPPGSSSLLRLSVLRV